jgi:hypothetical protein
VAHIGAGRSPAWWRAAGERDPEIAAAAVAVRVGEAAGEDPALEIAAQLAFNVGRDRIAVGIGFAPEREPGLQVLLYEAVECGALGVAKAVDPAPRWSSSRRWGARRRPTSVSAYVRQIT